MFYCMFYSTCDRSLNAAVAKHGGNVRTNELPNTQNLHMQLKGCELKYILNMHWTS